MLVSIGGKLIGTNDENSAVYAVTQDNADEIISQSIDLTDVVMDYAEEIPSAQIKHEDSSPLSESDFYEGNLPSDLNDWYISSEIRFIQ